MKNKKLKKLKPYAILLIISLVVGGSSYYYGTTQWKTKCFQYMGSEEMQEVYNGLRNEGIENFVNSPQAQKVIEDTYLAGMAAQEKESAKTFNTIINICKKAKQQNVHCLDILASF